MSLLKSLSEQLQNLWGQWTPAQRLGIGGGAVLCLAAIAAVFAWAVQPDYVVIASNLRGQQAADYVGALQNAKISAEMNFSATSVSVPRAQYADAKLALRDLLPEAGATTDEPAGIDWGQSPDAERDQRTRSLERRLAASITKIHGVQGATVLLGQPNHSPFATDQRPATASVIVELGSVSILPAQTAQSIVMLVARAVDGLAPESVMLSDNSGRQYSINDSLVGGMNGQIDYKQRVENYLESKAVSMLSEMLGPGHATVRVAAEIDFSESEQTERTFDPSGKVKLSENTTTTASSGKAPRAMGTAGVDANTGSFLPGDADQSTYKTDVTDVVYDNSGTSKTVRELPGTIKRLTISAVVDLSKSGGDANGAATPAVSEQAIQEVIKSAVGYDDERADKFSVVFSPLEAYADLDVAVAEPPVWTQYTGLVESASLGVAALVALILGILLIRRLSPIAMASSSDNQLSAEDIGRLATLSQQVRENPGVTASILNNWLNATASEDAERRAA